MNDDLPEIAHGIPVFPLPGMTLFPHTNLPLHIFEERYRNLMEDTLVKPEGQHCFAMGTLTETATDATLGDPPVSRFAGVGRITEYSRAPDGRYMLVLHGVRRVRLTHEMSIVRGYRLFGGEWISDVIPPASRTWERNLTVELKGLALALLREQAEIESGGRFLSLYQFTHALFRQYLYRELDAGRRRRLHSAVAAAPGRETVFAVVQSPYDQSERLVLTVRLSPVD